MSDISSRIAELWSQAQCHIAAKQAAPARTVLEALLAADPDHTLARLALCNLAWQQNRVREATQHALCGAHSACGHPELICETAGLLLRVGETVAARECLQRPALRGATSDTLLIRLADYWHAMGEHAEALAQMDRARVLGFDSADIRYRCGRELVCLGRLQEAEPELELGLLFDPAHGETVLELAQLRAQTRERNHLNKIASGLKNVARGTREHAALEFALYKELEDIGRYDEAWQALTRANAVMAQRKRCDVERMRRWFDLCIALCTREALRPAQTNHDGPQPIFIVGLPHTGTRELASLLATHPQVTNAGELDDFEQQLRWAADRRTTQDERFPERVATLDFGEIGRRYLAQTQWRARGKPYFIDSRPDNWMYAGLIHAALPRARILHVTREPMDACFAQYRALFGEAHEHTYELTALAAHYRQYRRLMAHWSAQISGVAMDVATERLLSDQATILQEVFACCGLDPAHPRGESELVGSADQTCGSRGTLTLGKWRHYASSLRNLVAAFAHH